MKFFKQLWNYSRFVARRFVDDRCLMVAGSLTYTSLLALVPLFTVSLVLTSHIPFTRDLMLAVKVFALKNLMPDVGGRVVTVYMEQFSQNAAKLTAIGLLIIVGTAVALMFTIDSACNDIWRTKRRRPWWKRLTAYLAVLAIGPLLIGASLSLTSYMAHWSRRLDRVLPFLDDGLLQLAPFVLTTLALAIAYRVMPARHVPTRHAVGGALFASMLFEIVKYVFVIYIVRVPTYSLVYGAFASVPIFLLWLFCCWMVALLGAEVAATLSYFRQTNTQPFDGSAKSQLHHDALRIINALAGSKSPQGFTTLRYGVQLPIDVAEDILYALVDAKLVGCDRRRHYQLTRNREAIQDSDIENALLVL